MKVRDFLLKTKEPKTLYYDHAAKIPINGAFKYLVSEFYSRDLSIKYKSGKYVKFRRGEYQSKTCPYGYQKGADGRMEPNGETAPNVQMIFELTTPHERPSQLRMKMGCEGREVVLNFKEQAKSGCTLVEDFTPFVQRGRIAQENSRMLHHASEKHE